MDFRPHIMTWTPMSPSAIEPGTGNEIPGSPGDPVAVVCRFHLGGTKMFRNEDSTEVQQKGKIRLDAGTRLPEVGVEIVVMDIFNPLKQQATHFKGRVMDVYRGQESYRIDV